MTGVPGRLSPAWLDYLAGLSLDPAQIPPRARWETVAADRRRLAVVRGIGVRPSDEDGDEPPAVTTEALLAGLAGEYLPFVLEVAGGPGGVRVAVGTWGAADSSPAQVDDQQHVVTTLLEGLHPRVDWTPGAPEVWAGTPVAALAHGVPGRVDGNGESPWDRLLRSMRDQRFGVLVLAEPVAGDALAALRATALEDLRAVVAAEGGPVTPLLSAYAGQVGDLVDTLGRAVTVGGWRVGVYLIGDGVSLWRLAAAWRAAFADDRTQLLPVRTAALDEAVDLARGWVLPYQEAPSGPGRWRHPFLNQTLLDTTQLAAIADLPRQEFPGFTVRPAPAFAVDHPAPRPGRPAIRIGEILQHGRPTGGAYELELDQLARHAFVAGLTGSGKTNTIMHLLQEASRDELPFLVIEPAKTEYRELLARPVLADRLQVFTVAREHVAPLRLNPFEIPSGVDVGTHLDLLKAVFAASFALWIPLPQVLEQCLVELYGERGWDFTRGGHPAQDSGVPPPVPTLSDLVAAVERTVPTLGYKPESTQEITASLTTRLNALRRGTRGAMLDVERSTPLEVLLATPTVIELEGLGDDADKAFVMGLLLIRLYEHRRTEHARRLTAAAAAGQPAPPSGRLQHLVVVEEAHRLVAQSDKQVDAWHADAQGAFADAFSQMLSEVRAYGQAMVIADQVPVRLAPDVLKNTNLKVVHRLVAGDDRDAMAAAMSMDPGQARALATLTRGQALVFSEGDHVPVVVAVPKAKDLGEGPAVDDVLVAQRAAALSPRAANGADDAASCAGVCRSPAECAEARRQAEEPAGVLLGGRVLTTAGLHPDGLDVVWPDVVAFVSARLPEPVALGGRVHSFAVHATHGAVARLATRRRWTGRQAEELHFAMRTALAERAGSRARWLGATGARQALVATATGLLHRTRDPYPLCSAICPDASCRYREVVLDVMAHPRHVASMAQGAADAESPEARVRRIAAGVAGDVVSSDPSAPSGSDALVAASWRALGCAAQVLTGGGDRTLESAAVVRQALTDAGWDLYVNEDRIGRWASEGTVLKPVDDRIEPEPHDRLVEEART